MPISQTGQAPSRAGVEGGFAPLDSGLLVPLAHIPVAPLAAVLDNYLPGYELDYVERTTAVTLTGTTIGAADTVLTSNSISFDGSTIVWIEFWAPYAKPSHTAAARITFDLFIDSTDLGFFGIFDTPAANSDYKMPILMKRYTPSAGSHTFTVKCFCSATGAAVVGAGTGGVSAYQPAWLRVVRK